MKLHGATRFCNSRILSQKWYIGRLQTISQIRMMTSKVGIHTDEAPAALGPYSQAIQAGSALYISGQLGLDPKTMKMVDEKCVVAQTSKALENLEAVLKAAGGELSQVVSTTVLLASMDDFGAMNGVYEKFFPPYVVDSTPPPARVCFAAKTLPKNGLVEIAAIAHMT